MSVDPDDRIELLRTATAAIEGGDLDEVKRVIEELAHEDLEWSALIAVVQGRSYEGRAGMIAFFKDLTDSFDVRYVDLSFRVLGADAVLLLTTMQLRGRESGIGMDQQLGVLFEYEDGLVRRGKAYESHAEAIEAGEKLAA